MSQMVIRTYLSRVDENGVPHYSILMWEKSDGTNVGWCSKKKGSFLEGKFPVSGWHITNYLNNW